jgi:hypothetical protein
MVITNQTLNIVIRDRILKISMIILFFINLYIMLQKPTNQPIASRRKQKNFTQLFPQDRFHRRIKKNMDVSTYIRNPMYTISIYYAIWMVLSNNLV